MEFRMDMLRTMYEDPFFWHLVITHAWILATSFHVDCGAAGQLGLYTNLYNQQSDWSRFETLQPSPPYNDVDAWRAGQCPGAVLPGAGRAFGRLMDDAWQLALFTRSQLGDLTPDTIRGLLRNMRLYSQGMLADAENAYYETLQKLCGAHGFLAGDAPAKIAV
jgi:hypothetical protein